MVSTDGECYEATSLCVGFQTFGDEVILENIYVATFTCGNQMLLNVSLKLDTYLSIAAFSLS